MVCPSPAGRPAIRQGHGATIHELRSIAAPLYPELRCCPRVVSPGAVSAVIRSTRPDVIHLQNHFFVGRRVTRAARRSGVPLVATNHFLPENLLVHVPGLPKIAVRGLVRLLWMDAARVLGRADQLAAPTPFAAELLERRGVGRTVEAISCGIDPDRYRPRHQPVELRARLGLADRPTLICVGRLDPDKHIEEVIGALAIVRKTLDAQLPIVGRGKERERLKRAAYAAGVGETTLFTGFVGDRRLLELYDAADVYVGAGVAELQSISALEAMAFGLPVVVSDAMALPLLVNTCNGHSYPSGRVPALAARLIELLSDPVRRASMGAASRQRVIADHQLGDTVAAYERVYAAALGHRPRLAQPRVWGTLGSPDDRGLEEAANAIGSEVL